MGAGTPTRRKAPGVHAHSQMLRTRSAMPVPAVLLTATTARISTPLCAVMLLPRPEKRRPAPAAAPVAAPPPPALPTLSAPRLRELLHAVAPGSPRRERALHLPMPSLTVGMRAPVSAAAASLPAPAAPPKKPVAPLDAAARAAGVTQEGEDDAGSSAFLGSFEAAEAEAEAVVSAPALRTDREEPPRAPGTAAWRSRTSCRESSISLNVTVGAHTHTQHHHQHCRQLEEEV